MPLRFFIFSLFFLLGPVLTLFSQNNTESDSTGRDSLSAENETIDERNKPLGDTTGVFYFFSDQTRKLIFIDTSLNQFEYPRRGWKNESLYNISDLGHPGTPTYCFFPQSRLKAGFRVGLDAFFEYRLKAEDIATFVVNGKRPFTDLYFSQIDIQNVFLRARFAHQITPELYYSIYYGMLNYNGFFNNHRSRHQDISVNIRYQRKKYSLFVCFINNANNQSENGGLTSNVISNVSPLFLVNLPVQLNPQSDGPKNENRHQYLSIKNYFKNSKSDSLSQRKEAGSQFGHHFIYENNVYKYFDKNPSGDSSFYGNFQSNNRGIRHYIRHQVVENELSYRQALSGDLSNSPLIINFTLSHRWNIVLQEPEFFHIHNFYLGGEIFNVQNSPFNYKATFKATNSRNGIDFFLRADASFLLKNRFLFGGQLIFQRYEADQIARKLFVSSSKIWDNNSFTQSQDLRLNGFIAWPKWWGKLEFSNLLITNPIYYDTSVLTRQLSGSVNLFQIALQQDVHIWKFHLENRLSWQQNLTTTADIFRMPRFLLFHSLYFEGRIIKNLLLRTGVNLRYTSQFKANAYAPLLSGFYLQNNQELSFYPVMDVFISAKIWQFRFFVNAENLSYFMFNSKNYYVAPNYPSTNWFVRMGVSWQLFD